MNNLFMKLTLKISHKDYLFSNIKHKLISEVVIACLIFAFCVGASPAYADISVGPYTFDNLAFADNATQIDTGTNIFAGGAISVFDALTGFSPTKGIVNIGADSPMQGIDRANLFQLDFTDLMAVNNAGVDIVLFDARFSTDPYSIAVRPTGGSFTSFLTYPTADQVATGVAGPTFGINNSVLFGIEIDLSAYGLASGTIVDAIRFSALEGRVGFPEGDPVMAAVLNGSTETPIPEPATMLLLGSGLIGLAGYGRKKFSKK